MAMIDLYLIGIEDFSILGSEKIYDHLIEVKLDDVHQLILNCDLTKIYNTAPASMEQIVHPR
jgi:hypothetical protein